MPNPIDDVEPLPGYPEPYDLLCAVLQDGTREWRNELPPDLGEEVVAWQPYPGSHSIGGILLHIIAVEIFWFEQFAMGIPFDPEERKLLLWEETDVDAPYWPAPPRQPLAWYFELHDRIRARTLERIRTWPPADTVREHHGRGCTLRWVLGHVIQHEAYHGGQAALLHDLWHRNQASARSASNTLTT